MDQVESRQDRLPLLMHFAEYLPTMQEAAMNGYSLTTSAGTTGGDSSCEDANMDHD